MNINKPTENHLNNEEDQHVKNYAKLCVVEQQVETLKKSLLTFLQNHEAHLEDQIRTQEKDWKANRNNLQQYKKKVGNTIEKLTNDKKGFKTADEKSQEECISFIQGKKVKNYFSKIDNACTDFITIMERTYIAGMIHNLFKTFFYINKETFSSFITDGQQVELGTFFNEMINDWNETLEC